MKLWAIGDLHLSFDAEGRLRKPMDIFGANWKDHPEKIRRNWQEKVSAEDFVLVPGDLSWAMDLAELSYDAEYLKSLPGRKILLKGNHDYWWTSRKKMEEFFSEDIVILQNDHYKISDQICICGTRGWTVPGDSNFSREDEKIFQREVGRLRLSLESVQEKNIEIIVMFHYPPTNMKHERSMLIDLLEEYKVKTCVYAHLHDASIGSRLPDSKWGINFVLASADALAFSPFLVKIIS